MNLNYTQRATMINLLKSLIAGETHTVDMNMRLTSPMVEMLRDERYIECAPENIESDGTVTAWDISPTPRGQVIAKTESFDIQPLWAREHPSIDDAPIMEDTLHDKWYGDSTWNDESWHNDVCPCFTSYDLIAGKGVRIWSENKNPARREMEEEPQFMVHKYNVNEMEIDGKTEYEMDDFIETLLCTDSREEVFNWILEQERKNEIARREAEDEKIRLADLKMAGLRPPTFDDMQKSREFQINFYDAMLEVDAGIAKDLDGEVGFTYFDKHGHIVLDQKTGNYHVNLLNIPASFYSLGHAERYLWDEWLCGEASPIEIEMSELDCLIAEYNNFLKSTGLPPMSADELLVQTKPDSDEYIANQWQRNYLSDYINRWDIAQDLDGTIGRTPSTK